MQYEFESGETDQDEDSEAWEAGIDHKTPQGGPDGIWYSRIQCVGDTEEDADALRDRVLNALQEAGEVESERGEALTVYDDAIDACMEVERTNVPGDVIREMNDEICNLRNRAEKAEALIRMLAINVLTVAQINNLEQEDREAIENIIKMPGMRDDS